jgi:hypothetical protein
MTQNLDITQEQLTDFQKEYGADVTFSYDVPHGSFRPKMKKLLDDEGKLETATLNMPKVRLAEFMREKRAYESDRKLRESNESLQIAWDNYQTLLNLSK